MSTIIQNRIRALRDRAVTIGLNEEEEKLLRALAAIPAESASRLDELSASLSEPMRTPGALAAFFKSFDQPNG